MLHIITLLAMASAVALGIYLAYVPYEEEFQYLAFILAILVPLISLLGNTGEGLSLGVDVRHRGARVFIAFFKITCPHSSETSLLDNYSCDAPNFYTYNSGRGRDPAYAFLLIGQVMCALGTLCPLFCWLELPLWLPSYFLLLLAFFVTLSSCRSVWIVDLRAIDLIFSGGGDTNGGSDDEGSAAANSIMHALADGDRGVWC
ncbi:hypothetical protein Tco_1315318 [Tanacetum coccineum]